MVTAVQAPRLHLWVGLLLGGLGAGIIGVRSDIDLIPNPELTADVDSTGQARIRLIGLDGELLHRLALRRLEAAEWERILAMYVDSSGLAVAGDYHVVEDGVEFEPAFALIPGLRYTLSADLDRLYASAGMGRTKGPRRLTRSLALDRPEPLRRTEVVAIYPSAGVVPANLLKFYIEFSRPMREGDAATALELVDSTGAAVPAAFLGLETELWDAAHRRLTVLLDPGRIKRGLRPNRELGPPLVAGGRYRLRVSPNWRDAEGAELLNGFEKSFRAGSASRVILEMAGWRVQPPAAGTTLPIVVGSPRPLDYGLIHRMVWVAGPDGARIAATIVSGDGEQSIRILPRRPWVAGVYQISFDAALEDLAGNTFQRPFDVDLGDSASRANDGLSVMRLPVTIAR